eukprot:TRINITY_DN75723_c0_g1_i1.p1 TRINITY_DN75723_c0_g1~~TRINITY_DN75723_c0_g1_i1.p1  ORF type:complete len:368 (-),score=52.98 TRINITY_DN75723_c0_g1_i1:29-1060(-)
MPRYLIVGAGAVGQPLAAHLVDGGANVAFLVKEKYGEGLKSNPLKLHWLPMCCCRRAVRRDFTNFEVLTSVKDAVAHQWDAVIITVASTALRDGTWLQELVDQVVKPQVGCALVFLTSAMTDRALFAEKCVPDEQVVQGGINFISWQAPLPQERWSPIAAAAWEGVAKVSAPVGYVLPSFVLSGSSKHTTTLAKVMNRGGMSCSVVRDVEADQGYLEAILMPILVSLENEAWNFSALRRSGRLTQTARAARECMQVSQVEAGKSFKWKLISFLFIRSWLFYLLILLAPRVFPFDIEAYLKYHFLKVGDQTKQYIDHFVEHGRIHGSAVANVVALRDRNSRWQQ